jgi:hypothetical protein
MRTILPILAAAALGAVAASPVAAQQAAATNLARPIVPKAPAPRLLATYRVTAERDGAMPAVVTVADSAGALVASYRLPGARDAQPMEVFVMDADLVLQGETPSGLLTLQLAGLNEAEAGRRISGRWWLGRQSGALTVRPIR